MSTQVKKATSGKRKPQGYYSRSTVIMLRAVFAAVQLVPPVAVRLAHRMFYVPRSRRKGALSLPGLQQVSLEVRGKRVACYTVGTGRPALVIHGWESAVSRLEPLIQALVEAGFQVITFDMPAHGQSAGQETDIIEVTEIGLELERRFGPFSVALAHSYGGACLVNLVRQGMKIDRLVLFATPASYVSMIDRFSKFLGLWPWVKAAFVRSINRRYAPHRLESELDTVRSLSAAARPTLVVHDVGDLSIPYGDSVLLARAHPRVSLLPTEGLGHNKIMTNASVIGRCIEFLTAEDTVPLTPGLTAHSGPEERVHP
jgi:pimeloyl-ACP methyl ester carboxylesterase